MAKFIKLISWGGRHAEYHNTDYILRFLAPLRESHFTNSEGVKSDNTIGSIVDFRRGSVSTAQEVDQTPEEIMALISEGQPQ